MIIIPTYNERKNIGILVGRIRAALPEISILFVEDNSPDGTGAEIKNLQTKDKNIHILERPGKAGFASAYLDGFRYALKNFRPEFVITMDADLSHPPEKLAEMIEIVSTGKVAVGSRYVEGGAVKNWKLKRKLLSRCGNLYARMFLDLPIRDLTGGFIAIPIEKFRALDLDAIKSRGYAFLMELKFNLAKMGSEIIEVPIVFEERKEGESKLGGSIITEGIKYPARVFWVRQKNQNSLAWLTFFISFFVYVSTLPKTIFFGDSPEFMAVGATLGIAHPPGYPLYAILAKAFTFIPIGNLEFRIGLFSAVCASLALVVFYFLLVRIVKNRSIAFVTSLVLGFSSLFWSQAIMAKVYMPLLLIILAIFLLFVKFWEIPRSKYLVTAAFLFGIGFAMHQMIILFLPLLFFVIIIYLGAIENVFTRRYKYGPFFAGILLFLLGVSIYLYLPLRENSQGNFYDFSRIFHSKPPLETMTGVYNYVMRTEYQDFGGEFSWEDKRIFITSFFEGLWKQFYWLLGFAILGLIKLVFSDKRFFVLTLGAFLINILGIILLRSSPWNYENGVLYSYYYLPAYAMAALWLGIGLHVIVRWIANRIPRHKALRLSVIMIVLPLGLFYLNFGRNDLSKFSFVDNYTREILESLEPNAVLLAQYNGANADTLLFGLNFQQKVKDIRPDVTILKIFDMYPEIELSALDFVYGIKDPKRARYFLLNSALKNSEYNNRPIYTTYLIDNLDASQTWTSVSNGLVYKFHPEPYNYRYNDKYNNISHEKDLKFMIDDMYGLDLLAQYFYAQAAYFAGKKDLHQAQTNFINGIKYDYKLGQIDQNDFIYYRDKVLESTSL